MKTTTIIKQESVTFILFVVVIGLTACGPNETILKSNSPTPTPITGASSTPYSSNDPVEKEVEAMRTANFNYIFVLRRKDGGMMDSDDKAFVRAATANFNRRTLSDDGKAVIVGSNPRVPDDLVQTIKTRFNVEDFSKPEAEIQNSNAPANANMKP